MTTSITHTVNHEEAIRFYRKAHNSKHGTNYTNGQFADLKALQYFDRMVELMQIERSTDELIKAFKAATPTQQAAARAALSISEP